MSVSQPLLQTIEADDPTASGLSTSNAQQQKKNTAPPIVLSPANRSSTQAQAKMATNEGDAESGGFVFFF